MNRNLAESSVFEGANEEDQSMMEIECVMPEEQLKNAKKWKIEKLKQERAEKAAKKKADLAAAKKQAEQAAA